MNFRSAAQNAKCQISAPLLSDIDPVWLLRLFTFIPAVLIILAGACAIWMYLFVLSLHPESKPQIQMAGLSADVRITRDANGIPAIVAERTEDLAPALGYAMAQDRLWQMDYLRRAGQGRLSEIFGSDYVEKDHLIRSLRVVCKWDITSDSVEQKWTEGFIHGINKYISLHANKLPVEFSLLEYRPEPFVPADIQSIILALSVESSQAFKIDPVITRLISKLGDKASLIFPKDETSPEPLILGDLTGIQTKGAIFAATRQQGHGIPGFRGGCLWSVGQNFSRSGRAISACSLFQDLAAPGFWYKARLFSPDYQLSGAFIPGIPAACAGMNKNMSWVCNPTMVDDADLFLEILDSNSPKSYWKIDRWKRIGTKTETYLVKGGSGVKKPIWITETGVIVSDPVNSRAFSLRWTGQDGSLFSTALFIINRATNNQEFTSGLRQLQTPCVNSVWASDDGSHGSQFAGKIPIRSSSSDGMCPMPAWTGVHDWQGFVAFEDLPSRKNPAEGFTSNCDERPGGSDFMIYTGAYWRNGAKNLRLTALLANSGAHSRESFQKIQNDIFSFTAARLAQTLLEHTVPKGSTENEAVAMLKTWDFQMSNDSAQPAIYALWRRAVSKALVSNHFGADIYQVISRNTELTNKAADKLLFDAIASADPQLTAILSEALAKGLADGVALFGPDMKKWKWGSAHTAEFRHPVAGKSRFLEDIYNVGPVALSGARDTINYTSWSIQRPFEVTEGVTLKEVYDLTNPPQEYGVSSLGSSAHFFSGNYKDQTAAWLSGRLFRYPLDASEVRKNSSGAVLLRPDPKRKPHMKAAAR